MGGSASDSGGRVTRRAGLMAPLAATVALRHEAGLAQPTKATGPLWPGSRFSHAQRSRAIERGMTFIHATASDPQNFAAFGDDTLWAFFATYRVAADPALKAMAREMGRERALHWRRANPRLPAGALATDLTNLVFACMAADGFDLPDTAMAEAIRAAARTFGVRDFLRFDPAREPLPKSAPAVCRACRNAGSLACMECQGRTVSGHDLMSDALIASYAAAKYGVPIGASFLDVARLIPSLRPYPAFREARSTAFIDVAYLITHIVYVLNDYLRFRLRPEWLPAEFEFLKAHLPLVIEADDPETMGEFVDCLRIFGLTFEDAHVQKGVDFIMATQNGDGSWGDAQSGDAYHLYHATLTAVNGLMDFDWAGEGVSFPEALPLVRG